MATPQDIDPQVAERFKHFRINYIKLSQDNLVNELGITQRALSFIETGKRAPRPDLITKLVNKYKLNPDWLYKGVDQPTNNKKADPEAIDNIMTRLSIMERELAKLQGTVEMMVKLLQKG